MNGEYEYLQDSSKEIYLSDDNDKVCIAHFHAKIELLYVLEANDKRVSVNDEEFSVSSDNVVVSLAYDAHVYSPCKNAKQIVLVIPQEYFCDYELNFSHKKLKSPVITDKAFCQEIKPLFYAIEKYSKNENVSRGLATALLYAISGKAGVIEKDEKNELNLTKKILTYIDDNHAENLTLDSLAKTFGYSRNYMSNVFNRHVGADFCGYLNSVRLKKIIAEASTDKQSVTDLCFKHGFNSLSTFYRCFKNEYNKTPREFFVSLK